MAKRKASRRQSRVSVEPSPPEAPLEPSPPEAAREPIPPESPVEPIPPQAPLFPPLFQVSDNQLRRTGYAVWAAGRLMNQLRFMRQLAALTQASCLRDGILRTWDDLITVSRVLFSASNTREQVFNRLDIERQCWLGGFGSRYADEQLWQTNHELYQRLNGGEGASGSDIREEVYTSFIAPTDALCSEIRTGLETALSEEQQAWFHCAIRVDQLLRPVPAYHTLSPSQLPNETTQSSGWSRTAGSAPSNFEIPWMLGRLPSVPPPVDRSQLLPRVIFADIGGNGLDWLPATIEETPTSEGLAAILEEACLHEMTRRADGLQPTNPAPPPRVEQTTGEAQANEPQPTNPSPTFQAPNRFADLNHLGVHTNHAQRRVRRHGYTEEIQLPRLHFHVFERVARAGEAGIDFQELLDDWEDLGGRNTLNDEDRGTVDSVLSRINGPIRSLGLEISSRIQGRRSLVERPNSADISE